MNKVGIAGCLALGLLIVTLTAIAPAEELLASLGTSFTYQGFLKQGGQPLTGEADLEFSLWDAPEGGNQVGSAVLSGQHAVDQGLFVAQIDFGIEAFDGESARWLEIAVRFPAGSGLYTTLAPRQAVTAVPFALQTRGITVATDGSVGVGTPEPQFALDVNGAVRSRAGGVVFPDGTSLETAAHLGPRGIQEFVDPGDYEWTAPPGVHSVCVELWGAGGGGGGFGAPADYCGGGGGGGGGPGYVRTVVCVVPGEMYTMHVGLGGPAGPCGWWPGVDGQDGEDGEATEFLSPSGTVLLAALGGEGGQGGLAEVSGGDHGEGGGGGGVGASGGITRSGRPGGAGDWGWGGFAGRSAQGTVSPPTLHMTGLTGGYGGYCDWWEGFYLDEGDAGDDGYAILQW